MLIYNGMQGFSTKDASGFYFNIIYHVTCNVSTIHIWLIYEIVIFSTIFLCYEVNIYR